MPIDTSNKFMVGLQGEHIVIVFPPRKMTSEEAIVLAAHLVCLATDGEAKFPEVLTAVKDS